MTMTADDLREALSGLSTERVQRLADRLSADPGLEVTIGSWFPQCPMVLAGFDGTTAPPTAPERRFAAVWDRLARSERSRWPRWPWLSRRARREDVQLLLRTANAVLALRQRGPHAAQTDAALLHDVLERTDQTAHQLRQHFGLQMATIVAALTQDPTIRDYELRRRSHYQACLEMLAGAPLAAQLDFELWELDVVARDATSRGAPRQ